MRLRTALLVLFSVALIGGIVGVTAPRRLIGRAAQLLEGRAFAASNGAESRVPAVVAPSIVAPVSDTAMAAPMPVISRGLPAFASTNAQSARRANDDDYSTEWRSAGVPAWLAYDLGEVPPAQRSQVLAAWYNNSYGYSTTYGAHYNNLRDYTIEAHTAPGGGNPPTSDWTILAAVSGNTYHSRQHVVDLTGYNWVRLHVTAVDGAPQNMDAALSSFDLHDASQGVTDSWIFYGDSITAAALSTYPTKGVDTVAKQIHAARPAYFPAAENAGDPFLKASDAAARLDTWLATFPGKYVVLAFGTNDGCADANAYYRNMKLLVDKALAQGKTPVVPKIPWSRRADYQACLPNLNARLDQLYAEYDGLVRGPDLWTFFQSDPSLISGDNLHPTDEGLAAMRMLWAVTLLESVYASPSEASEP